MIHYIQAKNEDQWLWHCVKIYLNLKYFVEIKCAFHFDFRILHFWRFV